MLEDILGASSDWLELYDEFDAVELWDNSLSDTELIYSADHGKVLINKSKDYNWVPDSIKEKHS